MTAEILSLGEFGKEVESPGEVVFTYFGAQIQVNPDLSVLDMVDFVEAGAEIDEEDVKGILLVKDFAKAVIHADDFAEFWGLAKKHRQGIQELMETCSEIIAKVAERPTRPSSDSPSGPETTGAKLKGGSYSRALTLLEGRPDLQEVVVVKQEARQAVSA